MDMRMKATDTSRWGLKAQLAWMKVAKVESFVTIQFSNGYPGLVQLYCCLSDKLGFWLG